MREIEAIDSEIIGNKILIICGQKVMIDNDLAALYGVKTKVLNQAVKRNKRRFPNDFMFQLNKIETDVLVTNCDRFKTLKHSSSLPYTFTEQGVAMLSTVSSGGRSQFFVSSFVILSGALAKRKIYNTITGALTEYYRFFTSPASSAGFVQNDKTTNNFRL